MLSGIYNDPVFSFIFLHLELISPLLFMTKTSLDLDFGKVTFSENILIAELNEGILFDVENNRKLLQIGKQVFNNEPYGYISNRIHSYAINPMIYLESASTKNLKAIAVVTNNPLVSQNVILERQFFKEKDSFEVFDNLDDAVNWIKQKIAPGLIPK